MSEVIPVDVHEECHEFQDFTVKGDLEYLISEFQKIGRVINEDEHDFRISFEFRGSIFSIFSVKKAPAEDSLDSLGHLGHPMAKEQLLWRMFDQNHLWVVIIRCDDPEVHLSVETSKLFLSAVSCCSVFKDIPVVALRNDDGEFLSYSPHCCALKIYGDWGPMDSLKWAQAKLSSKGEASVGKISIFTRGSACLPSSSAYSAVVSPRAVFLPIGKYFSSPVAELFVDFINPNAQVPNLQYEDCPIWRVRLVMEPSSEPSVIENAITMLRTLELFSGQIVCPGENEDLHSKTKVIQMIKSAASTSLQTSLLQFVLFAQEPNAFKERFLLALLAAFLPNSPSGFSNVKKSKELLSSMLKLYLDVIQAVADALESLNADSLGIEGIPDKPIWSDPLTIQHISSIEFMLRFSQQKTNLKPTEESGLTLLNTDRPLIIPETMDDGSEGMTSDWADIHSDASMKTQKDLRAYRRLASDMQAFKAANPNSCLADFVRWHSPRDWNEATRSLSERMSAEDSDWKRMWEELPALSAEEQPPLLDPKKEIAKSLHYLQHVEVKEWLNQMNPHFSDLYKKLVEKKVKSLDLNVTIEESKSDSEQLLWGSHSLKSLGFDNEKTSVMLQGKCVLISQEIERDAILQLKPRLFSQEIFVEGTNNERFYVKCNFNGTTMLGQG